MTRTRPDPRDLYGWREMALDALGLLLVLPLVWAAFTLAMSL